MTKQITKFNNIQAMRGVAALIVVFFHFMGFEKLYGHGLAVLPSFCDFGAAGVDIFFVISGFVMATIIRGKFQDTKAIPQFLLNRVTRIYPLYWLYSFLLLIALLLSSMVFGSSPPYGNLFKSFLLLPQNSMPFLAVGWTLVYEIYFYLVIALILFFSEKKFLSILGVWIVFIVVGSHFTFESATMRTITNPLAIEFIAGCLIARFLHYNNKVLDYSILILGFLILFLGFGIYNFNRPGVIPEGWIRIVLFGIPSIIIIYAAVALELNAKIFPQFLCNLGDASYSIYLSHLLVLIVMGKIWRPFHPNVLIPHLLMLVLAMAAVIIYGSLSYRHLERPLIFYFRELLQPRPASVQE